MAALVLTIYLVLYFCTQQKCRGSLELSAQTGRDFSNGMSGWRGFVAGDKNHRKNIFEATKLHSTKDGNYPPHMPTSVFSMTCHPLLTGETHDGR